MFLTVLLFLLNILINAVPNKIVGMTWCLSEEISFSDWWLLSPYAWLRVRACAKQGWEISFYLKCDGSYLRIMLVNSKLSQNRCLRWLFVCPDEANMLVHYHSTLLDATCCICLFPASLNLSQNHPTSSNTMFKRGWHVACCIDNVGSTCMLTLFEQGCSL